MSDNSPIPPRRRIVFMGTPEFAVPSLQILARNHDVVAVYSQPPRRSGRGMKLRESPVHQAALELGIDVRVPLSFDDPDEVDALKALEPDFLVVVAYGIILPQEVLDVPHLMAINGHASLLPRWRGAAPIQRAIAAGDEFTGVTAMKMEAGLDMGPILMKTEKIYIISKETAGDLSRLMAHRTAWMLLETVSQTDELTSIPQDNELATWANKITPQEAEIDFTQTAVEIDQRVRAFTPYPGAWLTAGRDGEDMPIRLKVKAVNIHDKQGVAGTVLGQGLDGGPLIAAREGSVELIEVQPQGKPAMSGRAFLNGNSLPSPIPRSDKKTD